MNGALAPEVKETRLPSVTVGSGSISPAYRNALKNAKDNQTVLTNLISGRPARGIINRLIRELGPISDDIPQFPLATAPLMPLRAKAEASGSGDFSPMWSGQAACLARELPAGELTKRLATEALERLGTRCEVRDAGD